MPGYGIKQIHPEPAYCHDESYAGTREINEALASRLILAMPAITDSNLKRMLTGSIPA